MKLIRKKLLQFIIALTLFVTAQTIFDPIFPIMDCVWWKLVGKALLRIFYAVSYGAFLYQVLDMRSIGSRPDKHH